jgi:hypothetical protein
LRNGFGEGTDGVGDHRGEDGADAVVGVEASCQDHGEGDFAYEDQRMEQRLSSSVMIAG